MGTPKSIILQNREKNNGVFDFYIKNKND
jgi:hypothetical protein